MSDDISIRKIGKAGRITLTRPKALNALSYDMCIEIDAALNAWATDDDVELVIIDAEGEKAFCAGGDVAKMYHLAKEGNYSFGQKFWVDEYRMNATLFNFPKPFVAFMQGFTMGGGVGVSCHGSHRIVGNTTQIAMPECAIGLVPDVGGSLLLARAPGRLGEYLGTTGTRMNAADAIYAEFADYFIPEENWPSLIEMLEETGDLNLIEAANQPTSDSKLAENRSNIDNHFGGETVADILRSMQYNPSEFTERALKTLRRQCPLSAAATIELIHRVRGPDTIEKALEMEFRFTSRAAEHGDFVEGVRAAIIDKDRNPSWKHKSIEDVSVAEVGRMLQPVKQPANTIG